ncbi:hypothetical protein MKW94_007353 [Papaver nudicaule]|uniref:Uncharacterized protein n=1 Tax=Papaver nudicaule TaxID=74823 RepID=A0AA41V221_PAPNU|nr:hypothetical protein [Papaver nudicaule]
MKHFVFQQNAFAASCEEWRGSVTISSSSSSDRKDPLVCPKPRRLGVGIQHHNNHHPINDSIRPFRYHFSHQAELCDSKAGMELMDLILTKGGQVSSSPPYFCGSPPSRAENPLIQDARFRNEKLLSPVSPLSIPVINSGSSSSSSSTPTTASSSIVNGGGCVRAKFGHKPAMVRIEGFECRDRRNCGISAVA